MPYRDLNFVSKGWVVVFGSAKQLTRGNYERSVVVWHTRGQARKMAQDLRRGGTRARVVPVRLIEVFGKRA